MAFIKTDAPPISSPVFGRADEEGGGGGLFFWLETLKGKEIEGEETTGRNKI